jgi:hypothetical protein
MTVGCGISYTNTKTHIQYNWSIPKVCPYTYKSVLSTYTMYTNLQKDESFLDNRNSSTE